MYVCTVCIDDSKPALKFCFGILTNLTQVKHSLWLKQSRSGNELFARGDYGSQRLFLTGKTVLKERVLLDYIYSDKIFSEIKQILNPNSASDKRYHYICYEERNYT